MSLPSCITLRTVKGSVLSWSELDTNFICLNNSIENLSNLAHNGNMWHIPAGYTLTIESDYQHFIYGNVLVEGLIQLSGDSQLVILNGDLIISGGSIDGTGTVYNIDLPIFDTKITGLTYSGGVVTIQQNNGIDFSATTNILNYTPSSSLDTNGNVGDISWDGTYFYWKTSTNGWLRTSGQTW